VGESKEQYIYTIKEFEAIMRFSYGIDADYSNDGKYLLNLKNFIVPSTTKENQTDVINTLITYNTPKALKLILMDDSVVNYDSYNRIPHMLLPVITNEEKFDRAMRWCYSEMKNRINKFVENGVKDIDSFNQTAIESDEELLPKIVCIVSEASVFFKCVTIQLEKMFLNSNMAGIYFILFSGFSIKGLSIGKIGELLENVDSKKLCALLTQDKILRNNQFLTRNFDEMEGHQFEQFCASILRKNGFESVDVTRGSGDQGVDIIAERDGIKYAIQCKRYSQAVGNKAVQEVFAGKTFYHCHVGAIITNNYFTKPAIELAKENGIVLWDRDFLLKNIDSEDSDIVREKIDPESIVEKIFEIGEDIVCFHFKKNNMVEILCECNTSISAANSFFSFYTKLKDDYIDTVDFKVVVRYNNSLAIAKNENGEELFYGKNLMDEFVMGIPNWMEDARSELLNTDKIEFLNMVERANGYLDYFMESISKKPKEKVIEKTKVSEEDPKKDEENYKKMYLEEKAKEKAKLDALEEKKRADREIQREKIKSMTNTGSSVIKIVIFWIITGFCLFVAIPSICGALGGILGFLSGVVMLVLAMMACPAITKKTLQIDGLQLYYKYKKVIVAVLVIVYFALIMNMK